MRRQWYVIYDQVEHSCLFVSVNFFKCWMYLNLNGKTFKITFNSKKDYEYAKRGEPIKMVAQTRTQMKPCKIVFK